MRVTMFFAIVTLRMAVFCGKQAEGDGGDDTFLTLGVRL